MSIWINAYTMVTHANNQGYSALKTIFKGDKPYLVPRHRDGAQLNYGYTTALPDSEILDDALTTKAPDLAALMYASARRVIEQFKTEPAATKLYVWWSGGLDSTAILLELATHPEFNQWLADGRAFVVCDANSEKEYPLMWHTRVKFMPQVVSDLALYMEDNTVHVDGVWADELFGNYQAEHYPAGALADANKLVDQIRAATITSASQEFFLDRAATLESAFPAETLFQRLWWLEFSLSYQDAILRPYYNGSNIKGAAQVKARFYSNMKYRWFADPSWTPWAMQRQLQNRFENYRASKLELRQFILDRNGDRDYYENKPKVYSQGEMYFNWKNGITDYFACY